MVADLVIDDEALLSAGSVMAAAGDQLAALKIGADDVAAAVGNHRLRRAITAMSRAWHCEQSSVAAELSRLGAGLVDAVETLNGFDARLSGVAERIVLASPGYVWGVR